MGPTPKLLLFAAGAVAVAGAVGVAVGLSGVISAPTIPAGFASVDARTVSATACVDGPTVTTLFAGDRVVAVARSDDGAFVGVRSSTAPRTVWVDADVLTLDDAEPGTAQLPVGGACPEVTVVAAIPTETPPTEAPPPAPEPEESPGSGPGPGPDPGPAPGPGPDPGPAPDTTAPTLGTPSVSAAIVGCAPGIGYPEAATISVTASDDRGIASVRISWSGAESGSSPMSPSGSTWTYVYNPGDSTSGVVNFSMQATDTSNNVSALRGAAVTVECLG